MNTKVRMGMVGGGEGSFIGAIHIMAAALDSEVELVAGCFSSNPERGRISGKRLGVAADRLYTSYEEMMLKEAECPPEERMEFVSIVVPNHLHLPIATAAIKAGFHVLSDKPAAGSLEETISLKEIVDESGLLYGLTHTYAAYPLVRQAREMVSRGELGSVRRVTVAYHQGWLACSDDTSGSKQAAWRTDPAKSGESGCFTDIGTHAHNLVEYITGLTIIEVCADLVTVVEGRELDDDGAALFRLENSARGSLTASQVCAGEGNDLNISVYGELGSLFWQQESPNELRVKRRDKPEEIYKAGNGCAYLEPIVRTYCRTPAGHPEGYLEAFANIYRDFARAIKQGTVSTTAIEEGVRGMAFVRGAIQSSQHNSSWISLKPLWTS